MFLDTVTEAWASGEKDAVNRDTGVVRQHDAHYHYQQVRAAGRF